MDVEIQKKLDEQDVKLDAIYKSVEKTRRYLLITAWVTVLVIVLPLIGLTFVLPSFISNYTNTLNTLGN